MGRGAYGKLTIGWATRLSTTPGHTDTRATETRIKMLKEYGGYTPDDSDTIIDGYRLICTCSACPEQYDVFDNTTTEKVGYLRLRGGWFRADYPDCGEETVYEANPAGDGMFDDDAERALYLKQAVQAIHKRRHQTTKKKNEVD
jgi:hypothetical protein